MTTAMSQFDQDNIEWIMQGNGDWFGARLLRLIAHCDLEHRDAIRRGFPDYVEAYERWFYKDSYATRTKEES